MPARHPIITGRCGSGVKSRGGSGAGAGEDVQAALRERGRSWHARQGVGGNAAGNGPVVARVMNYHDNCRFGIP